MERSTLRPVVEFVEDEYDSGIWKGLGWVVLLCDCDVDEPMLFGEEVVLEALNEVELEVPLVEDCAPVALVLEVALVMVSPDSVVVFVDVLDSCCDVVAR